MGWFSRIFSGCYAINSDRLHRSLLLSLSLLAFSCLSAGLLSGQERDRFEEVTDRISSLRLPMKFVEQVSRDLSLPIEDPRLKELFVDRSSHALTKRRTPTETPHSTTLILHLRSDGGGDKVVTDKQIETAVLRKANALRPKMEEMYRNVKRKQEQALRTENATLPPLPRCYEDKTNVTERKYTKDKGKQKESVVDVLFLPPHLTTTSPRDIYGKAPEIIVYDTARPSRHRLLVQKLHVPCLPYRRRHTGKYLFEHFGEHSLRNYDGNPNGKGENLLE